MTTVKSYAVLNNINEVSRGDNFQGQIFSKFLLSLNKPETAFCLQCCVKDYHSYVGADGRLFCSFVKRNRVELLHQPSFLKDDNQLLVHLLHTGLFGSILAHQTSKLECSRCRSIFDTLGTPGGDSIVECYDQRSYQR